MPHLLKSLLLLLSLSVWAWAEVTPNEPFIHVNGEATANVPPDQFILSWNIQTLADNYDAALAANNEEFADLLTFFESNELPADGIVSYEIKTEGIRPNSWERVKPQVYKTTRDVKVTIPQIDAFPLLVDYLNTKESTEYPHISFGYSQKQALQDQLLDAAISNAKEKAARLTEKLGMQVKSVYAISEEHFMDISSRYVPDWGRDIQYSPASDNAGSIYYIPTTIGFRADIYVIFTIEKKPAPLQP